MKRFQNLIIILCLILSSCSQDEVFTPTNNLYTKFRASFEESTRTHIDNNLKMCWNAGDEISIFTSPTNQRFKFDGNTGDRGGTFSKVYNNNGADEEPTFTIVNAIYPYSDNNAISGFAPPYGGHIFTLEIPKTQDYAENSFGEGASPMIASATLGEESELYFRNVCGFLRLQLYGKDVTVDRIELTSINQAMFNQPISGVYQFWIDGANGYPTPIIFDNEVEEDNYSITLDCGEGVTIGDTEDDCTEFIFSLLPFSTNSIFLRFTVYTTDNKFQQFDYSTINSFEIERNIITTMAPKEFNSNMSLEVDDNERDALIEFYKATNGDEWTRNDNWCTDKPVGEWYGVEIHSDEYNGEVRSFVGKLSLNDNNLKGEINNELKDISNLSWLELQNNQLTSVDVSESNHLLILHCNNNPITSLSTPSNVGSLDCSSTFIDELNVSHLKQMHTLDCSNTNIKELNLSGLNDLWSLNCGGTKIAELNLDGLTKLTHLDCSINTLSAISWNDCGLLQSLDCNNTQLTSIDVSEFENLVSFSCKSNANLLSINASNLPMLRWFNCAENENLTMVDVSNSFKYSEDNYLICNGHKKLQNLNIVNCTKLEKCECYDNNLAALDVLGLESLLHLNCGANKLVSLDLSPLKSLQFLSCGGNDLTQLDISVCPNLTELHCGALPISSLDFSTSQSLKTIDCRFSDFLSNITLPTSIETIDVSYSHNLHSLDLTHCTQLKSLTTFQCVNLSSVKFANHPNLNNVQLDFCNLCEIDLSRCPNLKYLRINNNKFAEAPTLPLGLRLLDISYNTVPDLDISKHLELADLYCAYCQIPELDLTKHTELGTLDCGGNPITELDLRYTKLFAIGGDDSGNSVAVYRLWCASPTLKKLYLRPGWGFYGITDTRKDEYIHPNTEIIFMDID